MKKAVVSWSGGKDSALSLYETLQQTDYQLEGLLTSTSEELGRVPIHEVDTRLIQAQAEQIPLPLYEVKLPLEASNTIYKQKMLQQFDRFTKKGIFHMIYADLFLEDIKDFRDQQLQEAGMEGVYPLWEKDTTKVAETFISLGFQAIITTVDTTKLPKEMAGQLYDSAFLEQLPEGTDPCGENGEFHTFVFDGPIFQEPVLFKKGDRFETFSGQFAHIKLMPDNK